MKKMIALICSAVMATGALTLVACGGDTTTDKNEKTVMNVACNPEVEFVLDSEDKVLSVNALNEEGNLIINAESFEGKTAEEAVTLFVQIATETGFIVSGNVEVVGAEDQAIEISFSGEVKSAEEIYGAIEESVRTYLDEKGVTAKIERAEAIGEEKLEALVAEVAPYLTETEIEEMETSELIEVLYESRKETAEMYSQELKNAYYEAKAHAMEKAELDTLKGKANGIIAGALEGAYQGYAGAIQEIERIRMERLISEESDYQKALAAFREAKMEYLKYRNEIAAKEDVTEEELAMLESLEKALDVQEKLLVSLGESANAALDLAKAQVETAYNAVVTGLETCSVKVEDHIDEVSRKRKEAMDKHFTDFENAYKEEMEKAEKHWGDMKDGLKPQKPQDEQHMKQ